MTDSVEALYREGTGVRATFGADDQRAFAYYAPVVSFIAGVARPKEGRSTRLLDVGCGTGWSTLALARAGFDATGIDLNPRAFEVASARGCVLREGSATSVPFPSGSFDVVITYQCLEHVAEPRRALDEMVRVCKPGGIVAVVGPNLVSPLPGLIHLCKPSSWRTLTFHRSPGMARHPYGNTVPEILAATMLRTGQLIARLFNRNPLFGMRVPDSVPPFHADNDACYLCNPADLIAYFRRARFQILRRGRPGRPWPAYLFAGGTWIAARKTPSASRAR